MEERVGSPSGSLTQILISRNMFQCFVIYLLNERLQPCFFFFTGQQTQLFAFVWGFFFCSTTKLSFLKQYSVFALFAVLIGFALGNKYIYFYSIKIFSCVLALITSTFFQNLFLPLFHPLAPLCYSSSLQSALAVA